MSERTSLCVLLDHDYAQAEPPPEPASVLLHYGTHPRPPVLTFLLYADPRLGSSRVTLPRDDRADGGPLDERRPSSIDRRVALRPENQQPTSKGHCMLPAYTHAQDTSLHG
jgi:hypothetical protein